MWASVCLQHVCRKTRQDAEMRSLSRRINSFHNSDRLEQMLEHVRKDIFTVTPFLRAASALSDVGLLQEPQLQALKRQLPHAGDVRDLLQIVQHLGHLHGLLLNHPVDGSTPALLRHLGVAEAGLEERDDSGQSRAQAATRWRFARSHDTARGRRSRLARGWETVNLPRGKWGRWTEGGRAKHVDGRSGGRKTRRRGEAPNQTRWGGRRTRKRSGH